MNTPKTTPRRLSALDATFLRMETRDTPMHVGSLQIFSIPSGAPADFVKNIVHSYRSARPLCRPWNLKLVRVPLSAVLPAVIEVGYLDLDYHVRHTALPAPGGERELGELISHLHTQLLDRSRPLWTCHVIEGLANNRFAIYTKVHHALTDGVNGIRILGRALATLKTGEWSAPWHVQIPRKSKRSNAPAKVSSSGSELVAQCRSMAHAMGEMVFRKPGQEPVRRPFEAPRSALNTRVTAARRVATQQLDLARLRGVAKRSETSVNDVFLAICSAALRRHLNDVRALPKSSLIAAVPVSLRDESTPAVEGNAVGFIWGSLGTDVADPLARLRLIHASMQVAKDNVRNVPPAIRQMFTMLLMHHPLDNLYDKNLAFRRLSRTVDLLLHGHQHEPLSTTLKSPDAQLHVLAAGSIYEGDQGDKWINGFHCIDVELDDSGRPQHYKIQFWAWSPNGHWHEAGGIYESAPSGQLTIPIAPLNRIATSDDPPKATPSHNQLRRSFLGSDPVAGNEALKELIALGDAGEDLLLKGTIPTPATRQVVRRWMKYVRARGESAADVLVRRLLDEEDSGDVRENTILFAGIADSYHVNQKLGSVLGSAFIKSAYSGLYQLKTEPYLHNYQSILEAYGYVGGSVTWLLDFAIGSDFCWDKLRLTLFRAACASFAKSEMNPNSALLDFLRPESEEVLRKHPRRGPDDSWLQFDRHDVMHEAYFGAFDLWQSGAVADLIVSEWSHDPNPMIRAFGAYILERYAFARLDAEIRRWLGREEDVEIQSTLKSALRSAELHEARPVYGATPRPIDAEGVDKTRGDPYAVVILARGGHRVEGLEAMLKASNPFTRGSAALALSYLKDSKYFSNSKRLIREASTPLERVFLATAMANLGVAGISLHDALVEAADVKNDFRQRVEVRWLLPYLQLAILDGLAVSASEDQFDAWKQEMESFN